MQRYKAFREVLKGNNEVLMTMGDMQEKASGAYVFAKAYTLSSYRAVSEGIKRIIDNLDILADKKYKGLIIAHQKADAKIRKHLASKTAIPETDYVLGLKDLGKDIAKGTRIARLEIRTACSIR